VFCDLGLGRNPSREGPSAGRIMAPDWPVRDYGSSDQHGLLDEVQRKVRLAMRRGLRNGAGLASALWLSRRRPRAGGQSFTSCARSVCGGHPPPATWEIV
jgi:hypothetical protein